MPVRLYIIYLILSSITLAECAITVLITTTDKSLKSKACTVFANSLSGSIALLSGISLLCNLYFLLSTCPGDDAVWPCILLTVCVRYLHTVSCFNLACLALDRYLAICWPLHYYMWLTKSRCRLLSAACWTAPAILILLPCAAELPTMCQNQEFIGFLSAYIVAYSLGASATFFLYILVAREFQRDSKAGTRGDKDTTQKLLRMRTARSALSVVALYLFFSLPHTVFPLVKELVQPEDRHEVLKNAFHVINRVHLCLFLPVYAWANADFQQALKAWTITLTSWVTCRPCSRQTESHPQEMSTTETHDVEKV